MHWYLKALSKYAVFSGRARRKEYWMFALINAIALLALAFWDGAAGTFDYETGGGLFSGLYSLLVLLPSLAVGVRRLHDTGRSGWWLLISFIPLIGFIVLLVFLTSDSEGGPNRFGPNPKVVLA